jgi:hypothetical protein
MTIHQNAARQPANIANASQSASGDIFSSFRLGELELANRMVMAPMTRSRAVEGNVPNPLAAPITLSVPPPD